MQSNEQHIPDQTRSLNTMVHKQIGLESSTLECSGCFNLINERYYLSVNDRVWHLNCLRCTDCKLCLDTQQSCFAKDGFIYCKDDYFKRFPRKCHGCCQQLSSNELIMKAKHLLFHIQCFKCLLCDKQLNPGDEFGIDRDGFTVLCRLHYYNNLQQQQHQSEFENNLTPYNNNINSNVKTEPNFYNNPNNDESHQTLIPSIYNQQQQIMNNYDSSSYLLHHPATNMFNQNLINPKHQIASSPINQNNSKGRPKKRKTTNSGDNQPVAKKQTKSKQNTENNKNNINNNKLHSATPSLMNNNNNKQEASLNSEALSNNNLLVNQQQQHQSVNLNNPLILGSSVESPDDYTKHFDSNLDYYTEDDENNHNNTTNNEDDDDDEDGEDDEDLLLDTSSNGQANNNNDISLLSSQHNNSNGYYDSVAAVAAAAAAAQRQKRMRTSFKHHQLRVMKSYFELNHNPDAKDLKQLSQKTGLSKRVLQVWFQNARAKFRRGQGGPCDQMTASNSSSQQLSPNSSLIINNNNNSKELSTDLAGHGSLLSHHNDLLDENSSQSLSDKKTSSASSFSSSSSSNNIKSETSYSILTNSNSVNNNLFHHQHPHHHLHLQQQHHLIQQQLQINSNRNDFTSSNLIVDNLVIN